MNFLKGLCLSIATALVLSFLLSSPSVAQSASNNYYYVWDTRPPDAYLSLRTQPSGSVGQTIMEMPNGTLLEVIEKRADGWWHVRVVANGKTGWALNRQGSRVWIFCCTSSKNTSVAVTDMKIKIAAISSTELRRFGIAMTEIGSGGAFPNACPSKTYKADGTIEAQSYLLSVSDAMLKHFSGRGFSLEALCLALLSPIRFDPETGNQLPLVSIKNFNNNEFRLNVPNCFRNGKPLLDCTLNYDRYFGTNARRNEDELSFVRSLPKIHACVRARLLSKPPGHWYHFDPALEKCGSGSYIYTGQHSPNLPQGYGYFLNGPEGGDPETEQVDLQTFQENSGLSAPWDQ